MRLIAVTNDVALQMGLSSLEPDLMVVHLGAPEGAPTEADVVLIDVGDTTRGLEVVAGLRARGIDMPCVVIGESDTGGDPTAVPLLRPFTLDEVRDALLASGTPYVRAHGGSLPGAGASPSDRDETRPAESAKLSRKERKELERAAKARAMLESAAKRAEERKAREEAERTARLEKERAEAALKQERERLAKVQREEQQRAEEAARIERERAERSAREERERAAEAARLEKVARAQRERAERAAKEAESAARRELQRAEEAARREAELEEAARRELAALAGREVPESPRIEIDALGTSGVEEAARAEEPESKRARKERQRAERALRDAQTAREERARAEQSAREEQARAEEAAKAAAVAREERERVEQARSEHERRATEARVERERLEAAAREERARLERVAREEREAAEEAAKQERARAAEAARAEKAARDERERAEANARAERQQKERAERAAHEESLRLEREERERTQRVEKARQAALARAEEMARREAAQMLARKQEETIRARTAIAPRPEPRRPVSPPSSFVIPSKATMPRANVGKDLVAPPDARQPKRRGRLADVANRGFRARAAEPPAPPANDMTRRVETALRAGNEIGTILGMLPGLETPVATAEALLSELQESIDLTTVAIYGRDGDVFEVLAGAGITPVERASTVTAEHGLFKEVIGGSGVLIDPVDLARGLVAGVAGATASVLMAAPLWNEDRCHGVVVVGGEGLGDASLRQLCSIAERAAPSLALAQLIGGLRSALT